MQCNSISSQQLRSSIAGEEDPGAALDVVRSIVARNGGTLGPDANAGAAPVRLDLSCSDGARSIRVGVTWPHHGSSEIAELLGLVVAHHGEIADTAWSVSGATGRNCVELEVDEDTDGVFYVSRRDC